MNANSIREGIVTGCFEVKKANGDVKYFEFSGEKSADSSEVKVLSESEITVDRYVELGGKP